VQVNSLKQNALIEALIEISSGQIPLTGVSFADEFDNEITERRLYVLT
jgi:hypothetical protein